MSTQSTNRISLFHSNEFVVKNKRDFHEGLDRHGYCLPPFKSAGVTIDYLTKVQSKLVWCPLYVEVKIRSCYNPPKKDVVYQEVVLHLSQYGTKPFGLSDASKVSAEWLIKCLSTLNPDHRFFARNFQLYESESKSVVSVPLALSNYNSPS